MYGVGYHLTIEKNQSLLCCNKENQINTLETTGHKNLSLEPMSTNEMQQYETVLINLVTSAVPDAAVLSNAGKEISFQLPIISASGFAKMFRVLDKERDCGNIVSYGINVTTLDEVFLMVAKGKQIETFVASPRYCRNPHIANSDDLDKTESIADLNVTVQSERTPHEEYDIDRNLYWKHTKALLYKRGLSFKRDRKAWCCTTILPSIFVLLGFLALRYAVPVRSLEPLQLDLSAYNARLATTSLRNATRNPIPYNRDAPFTCQPGWCSYQYPITKVKESKEFYFFCGAQAYLLSHPSCSIDMSSYVMDRIDANPVGSMVRNINEVT